jgi:hypothetical protein
MVSYLTCDDDIFEVEIGAWYVPNIWSLHCEGLSGIKEGDE